MTPEKQNEGSFAEQVEAELLNDTAPGLSDEAKETLAGYLEERGMPVPDGLVGGAPKTCPTCDSPAPGLTDACFDPWHELASPIVHITDDPDAEYDASMNSIKAVPGWEIYRDAVGNVADLMQVMVDDLKDEDSVVMMFSRQLQVREAQQRVEKLQGWADRADVAPGEYVPLNDSGHDFVASQSGTVENPLGQLDTPVAPATSDTDIPDELTEGELLVLQTEKTIRELQGDVERLEQSSLRDHDAVQQWSAVTDFFNEQMAGTPYADMTYPLLDRVKLYVHTVAEKAARYEEEKGLIPFQQ